MTTDGCDDCGLAYSFYFGKQFHKKGCKAGGGRRDNDEDGVPNAFDCEPNNPDKQDKWKNKFNLKGKSKVNSVLKKIMG